MQSARCRNLGSFKCDRKAATSYLKKTTETSEIGCVVPLHDELAIGTLRGILRQAQIDPEAFIKAL